MEANCPRFEFLDHTSDILIKALGNSIDEAFEQAALGVYEIITNTNKVRALNEIKIEVEGLDLYNLLYRWIESLLYYTDSEGLVFSKFNVKIDMRNNKLEATVYGEKFDSNIHEHRTIVKAMTYSQMEIKQEKNCWVLYFVVDI
ncbi:MAG: archease [Caldisphaera sp.]|uniref:archease n=1 Tax=Caldisphaera sp. TaxID=2060322 RepID=UPI003D0B72D4